MKKKTPQKRLLGAELVARAEAEPAVVRPRDFMPAVNKLREKGYSWRNCAKWLDENAGIEIDHTHLFRLAQSYDLLERDDAEN